MDKTYLYPEFHKHKGSVIMFPSRLDVWRDGAIPMQNYIINLAKIISEFEPVYLFCESKNYPKIVNLSNQKITVIKSEYDDIWARDISPTFINDNGKIKCINWKFNAWGGKKHAAYTPWNNDDAFATVIASYFGYDQINVPLVLEGGSVITDGEGTLFTTRSVLCNSNRNPFKTKQSIEQLLKEVLGIRKVIWLDYGLAYDETNGHIDNVMTVVKPGEICLSWTDNPRNPNFKRVRNIIKILETEYNGVIHKIPLPNKQILMREEANGIKRLDTSMIRAEGMVLPASYVNIYFVNGGVIIPAFGSEMDGLVYDLYEKIFYDRQVVQVYSREPIIGGGGIHCLTHEIPL